MASTSRTPLKGKKRGGAVFSAVQTVVEENEAENDPLASLFDIATEGTSD
jgi:hypothetical protein